MNPTNLGVLIGRASPAILLWLALAGATRADIFQWEYINPADPGQGKQQSMVLTPGGAGVDAVPGASLTYRNLTTAYLIGKDLQNAYAYKVNLTDADLSQANLTNAYLRYATIASADFTQANLTNAYLDFATLSGADFTDAQVQGANFGYTGLTLTQLYSTATYQAHDLTGINLGGNDLSNGNFAGLNLTNVWFGGATLTGADFTDAQVQGAGFRHTGLTLAQLYSTATYQTHDLKGINLGGIDLSNGKFAGLNLTNTFLGSAVLASADLSQANLTSARLRSTTLTNANLSQANLTKANFAEATLTGADFTNALVQGANFDRVAACCGRGGTGLTLAQLYSTASYKAHDLTGIGLGGNDLSGGNFAGQNLTSAILDYAKLAGADFTDAQVQGAGFGFTGLTLTQLYSTASYQAHDLTGIGLRFVNLSGGNFASQNLTNTDLAYANLTGADFTDAQVQGANFASTGLTLAQLYTTASYQAHDLSRIGLIGKNLSGGNFAGQNLTYAYFFKATLTGADLIQANLTNAYFVSATLTGADTRGAQGLSLPGSAITTNLIRPNGHIAGLDLGGAEQLVVRDYDGNPNYGQGPLAICVDSHVQMDPGGGLQLVFEADAWDSLISFAPGIPVTLGGTLELTFAEDVNLATQVGRTFDLFDWTGVMPTGTFAVTSHYTWDLSRLYSSGEVTLLAVPEPASLVLVAFAAATGLAIARRRNGVR